MKGLVTLVFGTLAFAEAASLWTPLPDGWVFLQKEVIDSTPGIYHDRLSGACVHVDIAFTSVVRPLAQSTEPPPPGYLGVPVHVSVEEQGACADGRKVRAAFFPEGDGSLAHVWNFFVRTCGAQQYERVQHLLFGAGAQPNAPLEKLDLGRIHTKEELEAIELGRSFSEVRRELGATSEAECDPDGGFTAIWTQNSRPHYVDWKFRFNQDQQLIGKTVR